MLAPLADSDDLTARGITVPDGVDADTLLASASAAVRDAAGCAILETTSTVVIAVDDWCGFDLPAGPVTSVDSVVVASVPVVGWTLLDGTVSMPSGWTRCVPVGVTVTYTHGLPEVPEDIVDLVCGIVGLASAQGYGAAGLLSAFHLGEYGESYKHPAGTEGPSPTALPDAVRERLRARFGGSAVTLAMW